MTFVLLAVLLAASTPAPADPPAETDSYVLLVGDEIIGNETATRRKTAAGVSLAGTAEITTPGGTLRFSQSLDRAGGKTVRYEVAIAGGPGGATIRTVPTAGGWRFEVTAEGASTPQTASERPASPPSIVLDNNLASHLDLLTRSLDLAPGAKAAMTAAVPQAMQVFPLEVVRLDDAGGTRRYRLTMASVMIEIAARPSDGALLEARVPLQNATYRRKGWEPAKAEPAGRDPRERDLNVPSPAGDLSAVITTPTGDAPAPAVLLLSGSGPQDRDETIGPNKPLRDLAVALADRGVATLRYDKRTRAYPAKAEATLSAEYLDDAATAIAILRAAPGVDAKRVFVAGHSLGGAVAPAVARTAKDGVRGLILLAPAVRRVDEAILDQATIQMRIAGSDDATVAAKHEELSGLLARALDPANTDATPLLGAPPSYWRELAALDLAKSLGEGSLPFLVIQGEKDIQVRPDLDFGVLKAKVGEAGGRATYRLLPGLNHLLMKVDGDSTGAEYAIPGRVAPEVAEAIAAWIASLGR